MKNGTLAAPASQTNGMVRAEGLISFESGRRVETMIVGIERFSKPYRLLVGKLATVSPNFVSKNQQQDHNACHLLLIGARIHSTSDRQRQSDQYNSRRIIRPFEMSRILRFQNLIMAIQCQDNKTSD